MHSDRKNKFRFSKLAIVSTFISVTSIAIVYLILCNHPKSLNALVDFKNGCIEVSCNFESQKNTK